MGDYGRLTVICSAPDYISPSGYKKKQSKCLCDCGSILILHNASLKRGLSKSCGCLRSETTSKRNTTHGLSNHYLFNTYRSMITRCYDNKSINYENYGGRGITVCDEWLESFEKFISDMGDRPDEYSLDRINNDLGLSLIHI